MTPAFWIVWSSVGLIFLWHCYEGFLMNKAGRLRERVVEKRQNYTCENHGDYVTVLGAERDEDPASFRLGLYIERPEFKKMYLARREYLLALCEYKEFERDIRFKDRGKDIELIYEISENEPDEELANRRFLYHNNIARRRFWSYFGEFIWYQLTAPSRFFKKLIDRCRKPGL